MEKPIYSTKIRSSELIALLYEIPVIIFWVLVVSPIIAALFVSAEYLLPTEMYFKAIQPLLAILIIILIIFTLNIFTKEVILFSDKIVIKHAIGKRVVYKNQVIEIIPLNRDEAKKVFRQISVLHFNERLDQTVLIKRKQLFNYVLTPHNLDEFLINLKESWGDELVKEI